MVEEVDARARRREKNTENKRSFQPIRKSYVYQSCAQLDEEVVSRRAAANGECKFLVESKTMVVSWCCRSDRIGNVKKRESREVKRGGTEDKGEEGWRVEFFEEIDEKIHFIKLFKCDYFGKLYA